MPQGVPERQERVEPMVYFLQVLVVVAVCGQLVAVAVEEENLEPLEMREYSLL